MENRSGENVKPKEKCKTYTTHAYRQTEKEIQKLMREKRHGHRHKDEARETAGLNFFHGMEQEGEKLDGPTEHVDTAGSDNESTELAAASKDRKTFIQIDLDEPLVYPKFYRGRYIYDDSLLYTPSNEPNLHLQLNDMPKLRKPQIRMLNRLQEEAKCDGHNKLDGKIKQQASETHNFIVDNTLYRFKSHHKFKSIFQEPKPIGKSHDPPMRHILRVNFKQFRFTQHPHLLEEHILAHRIEDLYNIYTDQLKYKYAANLRRELQMVRNTVAKMLESKELYNMEVLQKQQRLAQELRRRYFSEARLERLVLKRLLFEWAKLKKLRRQQRFQCTRIQLILHVEELTDLSGARAAWDEQFLSDLADIYREKLETFYVKQRLWKQREKLVSWEQQQKPPRKPKFEQIADELKQRYAHTFQQPEEPQVHVICTQSSDVTLHAGIGSGSDRNYFIKLYFDGHFVAQSRSYRLEPDLKLYMNECIGIIIERTLPEKIRISLYEKSTLAARNLRLATIRTSLTNESSLPHSKFSFIFEREKFAAELFMKIRVDQSNHKFWKLDDIQRLPKRLVEKMQRYRLKKRKLNPTSTNPTCGKPKPPPQAQSIKKMGKPLKHEKRAKNKSSRSRPSFPIFAENNLQLCSKSTLLYNKRFQLLNSRHQQSNWKTKDLRFIPSLEKEIGEEYDMLFPRQGNVIVRGTHWNSIDVHKHRGRKFIEWLYQGIRDICIHNAKSMNLSAELLFGEHEGNLASLWRGLCSRLSPTVPRKSIALRSDREYPIQQDKVEQHFTISLHVVRATGVPRRSRHILKLERLNQGSESVDNQTNFFMTQTLMYSDVRPFITLSYGQRCCRTRTAEGSNPTWNEQLKFKLSGVFLEMQDDIKISLFDEVIEQEFSGETPGHNHNGDIYQHIQCNWLGEYRVPISQLLLNGKFEGCIELSMPKVLVGYKRPIIDSVTNIAADQYPDFKETVHLWCYLSVEPHFAFPPFPSTALPCTEQKQLQDYLTERRFELQQLQHHHLQRYVDPFVSTAGGTRVCLTRILEPVPIAIVSSDNLLDSACRFVSLLSHVRKYDTCQSFSGVWLENATLLNSTWGSPKDLGVLLCNFMLSLGIQCWLVLGLACPHGESTFVLYRPENSDDLILIAPSTGKRYNTKDVHCPLIRVYCIVEPQNIYCNIQSEIRVSMTNFNLRDSTCWFPLFSKRHPAPQGNVQKLDYQFRHSYDYSELQKQIERKIQKKISSWRATRKTIWNRGFQSRLLKILREMEKLSTFPSSSYDEPSFSEELEREFPNYRLYGFTLNFPYTNLPAVSDHIRTTCIQHNTDPYIEFCCAVFVKGYANDVLSVWVFLMSMVPIMNYRQLDNDSSNPME